MVYLVCKVNLAKELVIMNKEEILSKSRKENKGTDERELQIRLKSKRIAKATGILIAFLLVLIDAIWLNNSAIGYTALAIAFGMNCIEDWIFVMVSKKNSEWVAVIFDTAFFIYSLVALIKTVI